MTRVSSLKVGINSGMDLKAINIYFIYRYSQCSHLRKRTHVHGRVLAKLQVCKTSKSDPPVIHACSCCTNVQVVSKLEFPRSLGVFRTIVDSHVKKRTLEWKERNQNTCDSRQLSQRNLNGVFTSSASRFLSQSTRVKIPRSNVPFQAANFCQSGRWSQIPLSERERGGLFFVWSHRWVRSNEFLNLFASPHNWRITAWDAVKEETPHWRPLFPVCC